MNFTSPVTGLNPEMSRRIAAMLVHSIWQGAACAILLAIALRLMRNRSANARYLAACAALGAMCVAAAWTFTAAGMHRHIAASDGGGQFVGPVGMIATQAFLPAAIDAAVSPSLMNFVVAAWAIGVAALSIWQVGGWCWLQMVCRTGASAGLDEVGRELMKRIGVRRVVRFVETAKMDIPAVIGIWRPAVLVPVGFMAGLSPQQVEAILAHELAHIRRWDYLANLVQSLIETLLFYHPAVWWISAQIRQERENCCDDIAAAVAGDRMAYAETLVMLEGRRAPALAIAVGGGVLAKRVRRLIGAQMPRHSRTRSAVAGMLAAACVIAVVVNRVAPGQTEKVVKVVTAATTRATNSTLPEDLVAEAHDYLIGANDLLSVSITDLVGPGVETVKSARVGQQSGEVSLPLIGNVKVAGMTAAQAERVIAKGYNDAKLIRNAQVSVTVAEARSNTFSILGLPRPGEYAISKADFRLLDALVLAGAEPGQLGSVTVMRKQAGAPPRQIKVAAEPLLSGDEKYNIVIRPGDFITTAEPEKRFLCVVVDHDTIFLRSSDHGRTVDKKCDWSYVEAQILALSPGERRATVLEIGVASRELPVGALLDAQAMGAELVKKYSMAYLSDVGVQSLALKENASNGVYYIGGNAHRVGVYQLNPTNPMSVKQAIIAAGMADPDGHYVDVIRRDGKTNTFPLTAVALDPTLSDPKLDLPIEPNDMIMITEKPTDRSAAKK